MRQKESGAMRYRCLILDHDDTVVNSTATVHYPSFLEYVKIYKPEAYGAYTLDDYFRYNSDPGVIPFFRDMVGLSEQEMKEEEEFWKAYAETHLPEAFPGMKEFLWKFRAEGGIIAVISHSFSHNILRDYAKNGLPVPDAVYGWEFPPEQRKPAPYAVFDVMRRFNLRPDEVLALDDLKPGAVMAKSAGVPFAAAGWANDVPEIETFMRAHSDHYFKTVKEFVEFMEG